MTPTKLRVLIAVAAIAAVVAWCIAALVDSFAGRYLPLPATAAGALWLMAIALGMWGWIVRPRLLRRPGVEPLPAVVAARTAALALAGSRVGAGAVGFYLGVGLFLLPDSQVAAARSGLLVCLFSALGGVALVAVSLWLESMCRLPADDGTADEEDSETGMDGLAGDAQRSRPRLD